ncbi:hypothetical protein [Acinetobacter sp.]|uniref:hypothetical protein n=1 Tax=Acinetobacter sp. TaxID=472 RepID=UPI002FD9F802
MKRLFLTLSGVILSASVYADKPLNTQPAYSMPNIESQQATPIESAPLSENHSYSGWSQKQPNTTTSSLYAQYLLHKGKFANDIDVDLKGVTVGFSTTPVQSGWWAELEYLKNSEYSADYYEAAFGGQFNLLNANGVYLLGTIGLGIGVGSADGFDDTAYLSLPVGLEAGYSITPNFSLYGGVGYKWNWDITSEDDEYGSGSGKTLCRDGTWSNSTGRGTCSHHGGIASYSSIYSNKLTIGDFDGLTYKAGLRYNF